MRTYYMIDGKLVSLEGFGDAPFEEYKAVIKNKGAHWCAIYSLPLSASQRAINECKRIVIDAIV